MSLTLAYQAMKPRLCGVSFDAFCDAFSSWEIIPILGGAVMVKGPEVHVATVEPGKWISRRLIRQVLGGLIERYGKAETSVGENNERGKAFVKRLGFVQVGDRYELRKLRHG